MLDSMVKFLTGAFFQSLGRAMRQEEHGVDGTYVCDYGPEHHASGTAHFKVSSWDHAGNKHASGYFTIDDGSVVTFRARLGRP